MMRTLIRYECRKYFSRRSVILIVLLFTIVNIVKIVSVHEERSLLADPLWHELYWDLYESYGGPIKDDKIRELMNIYWPLQRKTADLTASTTTDNPDTWTGNVYQDFHFLRWNYVNPLRYAYDYRSYAHSVVTAALENMDFYETIGNRYEFAKNSIIAERFQNRAITSFTYTEMFSEYTRYHFSAFLVLLICLYALMAVWITEKETEMDVLLLTATAGGSKTFWAKIIASVVFMCMLCFWFWTVDFATFAIVYDGSLEAALAPMYAIENYIHAALNINLLSYSLLSACVKTAGIIVIGLGFLLASCSFRSALVPYVICLIALFSLIYWDEALMGSGRVWAKVVNPLILVTNQELFGRMEFVPLFGFPLPSYIAASAAGFIWMILFLGGMWLLIRKNVLHRRIRTHATVEI